MANFKQMHCFSSEGKEEVKPIEKGLGFIMLSPLDVDVLKAHHKILHDYINDSCE